MADKKYFLAFDLGASSGRAILGVLENGKLDLQEVHRFENGHKRVGDSLYWDYPTLAEELKNGKPRRRLWGTRIKKFDGRWFPNVLEVETLGSGHRTKIIVDDLKINR